MLHPQGDAGGAPLIKPQFSDERMTNMGNLERLAAKLKTDPKVLDAFRKDPVKVVCEYQLTMGDLLNFVGSDDFPSGSMNDMNARLKLLEYLAKQ